MPPSDGQVLSRLYTRARMHPRTPLERLPFKDQQYYSTHAARNPHSTHISIETVSIMVPCPSVIQLCPPDIQPAPGVPWDQPARYPVWIFYPDGRQRCIATPDDLTQQPEGYVCYPHVPFPALPPTSPLAGMGETWYGPFAPHLCGYPDLDTFHPDDRVYAANPLIYGERYGVWRRSEGELFALEGLFNDEDLLKRGEVKRANPRGQHVPHDSTERVFVDTSRLAAYVQRYDAGDPKVRHPQRHPPQQAATPPSRQPERKRGGRKRIGEGELRDVKTMLDTTIRDLCQEEVNHPQRTDVFINWPANMRYHKRHPLRYTQREWDLRVDRLLEQCTSASWDDYVHHVLRQ